LGPPAAWALTAGSPSTITAEASAAIAVLRPGDLCLCRAGLFIRGHFLRRLAHRWGGEGGSFLGEWCRSRKVRGDVVRAASERQVFALFHRNIAERWERVYSWNSAIFTRSAHHPAVTPGLTCAYLRSLNESERKTRKFLRDPTSFNSVPLLPGGFAVDA
jgi:hypothetical protein